MGQILGVRINLDRALSYLYLVSNGSIVWPLSYLDPHLGGNLSPSCFWDVVVDGIARRKDGLEKIFFYY